MSYRKPTSQNDAPVRLLIEIENLAHDDEFPKQLRGVRCNSDWRGPRTETPKASRGGEWGNPSL